MTANVPTILASLKKARAGGPDLCVTFEADGDDTLWIQFVGTTLNCAWPFTEAPDGHARLKPLVMKSGAQFGDWTAGKFAIFEVPAASLDAVAEFIDRYFVVMLDCQEDPYHLTAQLKSL